MIAHLKELEILGVVIDGETQVDIVLITFLESFKFFRLSYSKSRGFCSLTEFLKGLQAAKGIISHQEHLQVVEKVSLASEKEEEKAPKPEGKCVAKGKWEQAERQVPPCKQT